MNSNRIFRTLIPIPLIVLTFSESLASLPPDDLIIFEQAKKAAVLFQKGNPISNGFEKRNGIWVYAFQIRSPKDGIKEIVIKIKDAKEEHMPVAVR